MAILTEGRRKAQFSVSEANDWRSRDVVTVDATGGGLEPGTILGKVTASGKYVRHAAGASDGSQTEAGILYEGIAEDAEAERTIIARDAEVSGADLTYEDGADATQITSSNAALASLGIIVR